MKIQSNLKLLKVCSSIMQVLIRHQLQSKMIKNGLNKNIFLIDEF